MAEDTHPQRFAVLIDADNTSPRIVDGLFEEVARFGEASVRRIYGDFSSPRLKIVDGSAAEARHRSLPAIRLHLGQERLGHRAGDRRHGPAAQRPLRRLLPGVVRQRFHAARLAPARGGRRRLRLRHPEDARELPPGLPALRLHREPAARDGGRRRSTTAAARALQPPSAAVPSAGARHRADGDRGRLGRRSGAVGQRLAAIASDFDPRTYGYRKLSDLVRNTGAFEIDRQAAASCASAPASAAGGRLVTPRPDVG